MTPPSSPLLGVPWSGVLIAVGLVGGHLMVLALATWLLLWLFAPAAFAAIFALLLAACAAAKVVVSGRWSGGVAGAIQVAAVVMLCASYVVGGALALASAADAPASQSTFATPRSEAITAFLLAAIAATAFAAVLVAVPISGRRGLVKMTAIAVMIAAAGGVGGAVAAGASRDPCEAFEFDRSRWRTALAGPDAAGKTSDAERIARAIDRCRTIDGATRTRVRRLLGGSQSSKRTTWNWPLGTTNDTLGPGDGQDLLVRFDRSGRARSVSLRSP